ncbi:BTAD domain-containing putative transcriptional regulator [Actinomycetes bacterium KLBMP 9759]
MTVSCDGAPLAVERPLERALMARLALAGGAPVLDGRLAEDLWSESEILRATPRLRVVASRLRGALGEHGALLTRTSAGYQLAAEAGDLLRAQEAAARLHDAVRDGDTAGVHAAAAAALACWRGAALADLRAYPFAQADGERLDAWHLDLTVYRIGAALDLHGGGGVIAELTTLAAEHPLHEPIACLLAKALYRVGRQADALDRLARLRTALAEELGVDPGPESADLELQLLRHDPRLLGPETEVSAAVAVERPLTRVPVSTTSFHGRDAQLAALLEQVSRPGVVTLLGGPGSGKSRLAMETARIVATGRRVVVAELAPLRRDDAVVPALVEAAGVDVSSSDVSGSDVSGSDVSGGDVTGGDLTGAGGADNPLTPLARDLDGGLLVLDNAEHLVEAAGAATRALRSAARQLTVLVTAQRPLLLDEEAQVRVGPLGPAPAAALFVERAAPDAMLAPDADAHVATIAEAVDRLPLGIELAAGLTHTLSVAQLAGRIGDRLRLLTGGTRHLGGRHSGLRAAIDWSHELLDERERTVLRRVGVFAGGFVLEAAEATVPHGELDAGDVAPALAELVDRSLVNVVAVPGGGRRFTLLETVREYALEQLAAHGEVLDTNARHLAWCLGFVGALATVDDFCSTGTVAEVFTEWPNLEQALDNAVGAPHARDALRLVNALHVPLMARGWSTTALRHFVALGDADGVDPTVRAFALSHQGFHALLVGDGESATALLGRSTDLADDPGFSLTMLCYRGILATQLGQLHEALRVLRDGVELAKGHPLEVRLLAGLAMAALFAGDPEEAAAVSRRIVEVGARLGDDFGLASCLTVLAGALLDTGAVDDALAAVEESDTHAGRLDVARIHQYNDMLRALVAEQRGRLDEAERYCRDTIRALQSDRPTLFDVDLAGVLVARGDAAALDEASALLDACLSQGALAALAASAVVPALALARGDVDGARRLLDRAERDHAASGFGWRRYTRRLDDVRLALRTRSTPG